MVKKGEQDFEILYYASIHVCVPIIHMYTYVHAYNETTSLFRRRICTRKGIGPP